MILSLLKILIFVAAVAGLAWGAIWLTSVEGSAIVNVAGNEITLDVLQMVVGALLLILAVWLGIKLLGFLLALLRFLNGDDTAINRYFSRNRERRGFEALTQGMIALAAGDGRLATQEAKKADRLLRRPQLTNLLSAQAAEMTGDRRMAETVYKKLLEDEQTRFVGIHGIMKQKLAEGDTETALQLAERAFALKPRHLETQDVLLRLQADQGDWEGARKTLGAKLKSGAIPRDVHRRRDAVLALSEARVLESEDARQKAAIEANRLSPDLIPAAIEAARAHIVKGDGRSATRILQKAWAAQAHPDLAACFAEIVPEETPQERLSRFRPLLRNESNPEVRMLKAELLIAAEDFPAARRALGDLVQSNPSVRALTIMAAIERGEGADDAVVRGWLTKALSAPRGPQWVCSNCNTTYAEWRPVCDDCGGFDTIIWAEPKGQEVVMPEATELLPLVTEPEALTQEDAK